MFGGNMPDGSGVLPPYSCQAERQTDLKPTLFLNPSLLSGRFPSASKVKFDGQGSPGIL
jgi:hypothetical protein